MPADWADLTVEKQLRDKDSTLTFYRSALHLRASRPELDGGELDWLPAPADCLAFKRSGGLTCLLNASDKSIALPAGELLLATNTVADGGLPPGSAAWVVRSSQTSHAV
jgi:alpha-glucosidase